MMILPSEYAGSKRRSLAPETQQFLLKRSLDIALSSIALLVLSPVFAIVALAIRLDSPGPVIYAQERVGLNRRRSRVRNGNGNGNGNGSGKGHIEHEMPSGWDRRSEDCYGRPFKIFKFRSMVTDAERFTGPVWASATDSRVTRLGRLLRKTRLDEFPQLWNVLRGDMSLVGPRPERPTFVVSLTKEIPDYPRRCEALPGITGLAQVKWRYDTSIETVNRKLQYDLYYVRHGRFLMDIKIMAATFKVMARGEGAH
ncbi:MAG TPA: sugar transferase [Candidatus Eisenbacteria bacterium]|nr:sugar transferase [Candidatus Eisenbacteria bacterium]